MIKSKIICDVCQEEIIKFNYIRIYKRNTVNGESIGFHLCDDCFNKINIKIPEDLK